MSAPAIGARVRYCGHDAFFVADIFLIGDCNVIVANGPIDKHLQRPAAKVTHELHDFPKAGFWGKSRGIFVVPAAQVVAIDAKTSPT